MRKRVPHPVTRLSSPYAELDVLYGGNEADAMEESLKIACDLRDVLRDDENILYVNTLVSELRMAFAMGKRFDHGARRGRNFFVTYCSGEIIEKLPVIRHITEKRKIKYLVVSGFELAALDPRHRSAFMGWLRVMRNEGINVILFTMSQPGQHGTLGALRYSARTVAQVGAYLAKSNGQQFRDYEEEIDAVEEVATDGEEQLNFEELSPEEIENECHSGFADDPDATKIYAEESEVSETDNPEDQESQTATILQHSDSDSLKTKDLTLDFV